ncbi:MAG: ABC transporter ATP-binding protein, partial [Pedococcus sp.]
ERACDRQVALLGDGKLRQLPGGVDQYLELRHQAIESAAREAVSSSARADAALASGTSGPSPAELREARKDMARVEKQLTRLTQREDKIHLAMAEAAADHAKVLELNGQLREIVDERETLELQWLAAAEIVG